MAAAGWLHYRSGPICRAPGVRFFREKPFVEMKNIAPIRISWQTVPRAVWERARRAVGRLSPLCCCSAQASAEQLPVLCALCSREAGAWECGCAKLCGCLAPARLPHCCLPYQASCKPGAELTYIFGWLMLLVLTIPREFEAHSSFQEGACLSVCNCLSSQSFWLSITPCPPPSGFSP